MTRCIRLFLAQMNSSVGDIADNYNKIISTYAQANQLKADIVIFPECFLSGYPLADQVYDSSFLSTLDVYLQKIIKATTSQTALIVGLPSQFDNKTYNSLFWIYNQSIQAVRHKTHLPNEGVFDEKRTYCSNFETNQCVSFRDFTIALGICEDMWHAEFINHVIKPQQPDCAIFINASPYESNKLSEREHIAKKAIQHIKCPLIYLNQVGGQDELVFDGHSFVLQDNTSSAYYMDGFKEDYALVDIKLGSGENKSPHISLTPYCSKLDKQKKHTIKTHLLSDTQLDYLALMHGLRDYVKKNQFKKVILGISGGIDSALCATLAVDALGSSCVEGYLMPSKISSQHSIEDAKILMHNLSMQYHILPIGNLVDCCEETLVDIIANTARDTTEENIQSRLRGVLLMAIANKTGALLLTTGNKSEIAVGYATLYGDMNGGFNPIKDVYKSYVYTLTHLRNSWYYDSMKGKNGVCISDNIIHKAPSAELSVDQYDQDTLPEYQILDRILKVLIERQGKVEELYDMGYSRELIKDINKKIYATEHKRKQAAPGTKITRLAFGLDRRYPITNGFSKNL